MRIAAASVIAAFAGLANATAAEKIDFALEVKPIIESACLSCHGPEKPKADLRLDSRAGALKGGENGPALVPGKPQMSRMYTSTILPAGHDDIMPPKGDRLSKEQTERLRLWIEQGASWPDNVMLKQVARVNFTKDIQPLLELNCVACHREGHAKSDLRLDNKSDAFKDIVPFQPNKSKVYTSTTLDPDHDDLMPPKNKGGPLPKEKIDLLRNWIEQGAAWPEGVTLVPKKAEEVGGDEKSIVENIYKLITDRAKSAEHKSYTNTIPGTQVSYGMMAIPGGEYLMGSPASEKGRKADEGPQHKVKLSPFWMGRCEVTWNEFELFMFADQERKFKDTIATDPYVDKISDAVSRPTKPYVEMSFGMGKDGYPAISMTHHSAIKYCQWLSAKTGQFYRLPTEAEWEYACRAGTTTAYSWGDDPAAMRDYAWYEQNSDFKYQKVGRKKPNPWGLCDMHGNVAEWCFDQYVPNYEQFAKALQVNPWVKSTTPYPHVARGGSWDDAPAALRSAARRASDKTWKIQDPQLPKS
ncbi:MAG TPA: SUMF1/EgtB/PvdO family nonheme iron enzyme, partial [Verrucomicrobiae bacterium]|nr:SUMF1/EgtB/PvdO family nonheme iron enzyme [Verrucomicrobiae bacterium]